MLTLILNWAEILLEDFEKRITEISSGKKVYIKNFRKQSHKVCWK